MFWIKFNWNYNTWWIDSGCTTRISNTMYGFFSIQITTPNEKFVFIGKKVRIPFKAIGKDHLILDIRYHLDLFSHSYVPLASQKWVSLSKLDKVRNFFWYGNGCFSLFKHDRLVGSGIISYDLYKLNLDNLFCWNSLDLAS